MLTSPLKTAIANFVSGLKSFLDIHNQHHLKLILKNSLYILVTAESICILTAETVDLIFYQYCIFLSVALCTYGWCIYRRCPSNVQEVKTLEATAINTETFKRRKSFLRSQSYHNKKSAYTDRGNRKFFE
jgi:hypothetical protein